MSRIAALTAAFGVLAQSVTASYIANKASVSETALPQTVVSHDVAGNVTLRAHIVVDGIDVDGQLDEPIYRDIEPAADFIQQEPNEGVEATERTEAWILYDAENLYVSARLWDSAPEQMVANELRRDNRNIVQNESFAVVLDTFHDRRNGFFFQTNALGALRDGLITDERNANFDWNTVWDVQTGSFENGWTIEMVIPFKSLRFREKGDQVWGINLHRFVRWKNEHSFVNPVPASYGLEGLYRVSSAGTLVDLYVQSGSRTLELKPYGISSVATDRTMTPIV